MNADDTSMKRKAPRVRKAAAVAQRIDGNQSDKLPVAARFVRRRRELIGSRCSICRRQNCVHPGVLETVLIVQVVEVRVPVLSAANGINPKVV